MNWIAFFSQTGSEIVELANRIGFEPTVVVTNRRPDNRRAIHPAIVNMNLVMVPNKPTWEDYLEVLPFKKCIITLHGWLRIIPPEIVAAYKKDIYNGHPGLINKYPELKGKDPQLKAFDLGLKESGCVIHRVTEGVDEGEILAHKRVNIKNLPLSQIFDKLHETSVDLWFDFLRTKLSSPLPE